MQLQVVYAAGINEKLLGDFVRKHDCRDKVFSKCAELRHRLPSEAPAYLFSSLTDACWPTPSSSLYSTPVASKCGFEIDWETGKPKGVTNSAAHIKEYIEGTIERLGFAPDLYYLHRIDPSMAAFSFSPSMSHWEVTLG